MYAGTTFRHHSGNIVGVHQRIDRVARKHLVKHLPGVHFPTTKEILHFEGRNGPDGIKSKSPSVDEPWHFINPKAGIDDPLVLMINDHIVNLRVALQEKNEVRAAFEAAWLAHAVVDGLTPAHHVPLAEKIEELWGKAHHERDSVRDKALIKGINRRDTLSKNWEYWGAKGVFSAHVFYEMGIASAITTTKFTDVGLHALDFALIEEFGYAQYFITSVGEVDALHTYQDFVEKGWTQKLGNTVRRQLIPIIIKNVALAWYAAAHGIETEEKS